MSRRLAATSLPTASDRYLLVLSGTLLGYAMLGKGFAYVGMAPLYVGELVLAAGVLVVLRMGDPFGLLASLPGLLLLANMLWTTARTLPFIGEFGADALRDSVIVMYGAFSFVVVALLLEHERRVGDIMRLYRMFIATLVPLLPILFVLSHRASDVLPKIPGTDVPAILLGPGEVPVHMAGAAIFAMAGFYRPTPLWWAAMAAATLMASALTRGGMLAFAIPVAIAAIALGKLRQLVIVVALGLAVFGAAFAYEAMAGLGEQKATGDRSLGATQLMRNVGSIFGSKDPLLEGTKEWRLEWWRRIVDDTVFGERFWMGRGYGVNLALVDGFGDPKDAAPLRSPHNAAMTVLARGGVTGLILWLTFLAVWAGVISKAMVEAFLRGETAWANLFLWTGCYALAFVINALFDVALEGPMQGIWFWCVIGFGIGAVMIYRFRLATQEKQA